VGTVFNEAKGTSGSNRNAGIINGLVLVPFVIVPPGTAVAGNGKASAPHTTRAIKAVSARGLFPL